MFYFQYIQFWNEVMTCATVKNYIKFKSVLEHILQIQMFKFYEHVLH